MIFLPCNIHILTENSSLPYDIVTIQLYLSIDKYSPFLHMPYQQMERVQQALPVPFIEITQISIHKNYRASHIY